MSIFAAPLVPQLVMNDNPMLVDRNFAADSSQDVEAIFDSDPAGIFARMDSRSRRDYAGIAIGLARRAGIEPAEVARSAVDSSLRAFEHGNVAGSHVGHHLLGVGAAQFRAKLGVGAKMSRPIVFALVAAIVFIVASVCLVSSWSGGSVALGLLAPLLFLLALECALSISGQIAGVLWLPSRLPRMAFANGLPEDCRTLITIPCMLANRHEIERLLARIESHYLADHDPRLSYALLSDFIDSDRRIVEEDEGLLYAAEAGIEQLNAKHPSAAFLLIHRGRDWNSRQGVWMGRERKRGKLEDLVKLLRSGCIDAFERIVGDSSRLSDVRYVLTLDADNSIAPGCARALVAIMAHPVARPVIDASRRIVSSGIGILQPRPQTHLPDGRVSPFASLGVDPICSDGHHDVEPSLYQDLFDQGSYYGKGIFDVDSFHSTACARFPSNSVLSHDLLEGGYCRSALASDIVVKELPPTTYAEHIRRRHRWIRGDWQNLLWALPRVRDESCTLVPNALSALSRVKIVENVVRSLFAPAAAIALIVGLVCIDSPGTWVAGVLGVLWTPATTSLSKRVFEERKNFRNVGRLVARYATDASLGLCFLIEEAYVALAAATTAVFRLCVTRRKLLEWHPFAALPPRTLTLAAYVRLMWISPAVCTIILLARAVQGMPSMFSTLMPVSAWLIAPVVAWIASRSRSEWRLHSACTETAA